MFIIRFVLISFFLLGECFPGGRVDGVAVIVGKNIVLHSDVLQQAQFVALEQQIDPLKTPYLFEQLYYNTRDNIINQYAVLDVAEKDTNLVISNDEVDRALNQQIDDFIARAGSEKQFLEMAGMSMRQIRSDYWKQVRDMMIVERYQFSKIQNVDVSRKEVQKFYIAYKDSLPSLPEKYDFSIIEVPFVAGEDSEKETKYFLDSLKNIVENNGLSFDSLAQIYSQDPNTASSGGYLGFTSRGSLVQEYEEVAYSLSPGELGGPIKTDFGYHLIKLVNKQGEKISTQHLLRTIEFSEKDKESAYYIINNISSQIETDSLVFDSLANVFSLKYKNYSGKYFDSLPENIPNDIFFQLNSFEHVGVSSPIKTKNGYVLIYLYNHQKKMVPNLINSWNIIYNYAKQKKQNTVFQIWVNNIKNDTYIKIIEE